jgi:hypothetical protein
VNTCLLISYCLLVSVMKERGKENSDTEKVLLKALSSTKECRVGEVPRVESSRNRYKLLLALAEQYLVLGFDAPDNCLNIGYLNKAKYICEVAVIISTALYSSDDDKLLDSLAILRDIDIALAWKHSPPPL